MLEDRGQEGGWAGQTPAEAGSVLGGSWLVFQENRPPPKTGSEMTKDLRRSRRRAAADKESLRRWPSREGEEGTSAAKDRGADLRR